MHRVYPTIIDVNYCWGWSNLFTVYFVQTNVSFCAQIVHDTEKLFILLLLPYCIIFLQAVNSLQRADAYSQRMTLKFLKYAQSSQCENMNDSSVSYAAGALTFE